MTESIGFNNRNVSFGVILKRAKRLGEEVPKTFQEGFKQAENRLAENSDKDTYIASMLSIPGSDTVSLTIKKEGEKVKQMKYLPKTTSSKEIAKWLLRNYYRLNGTNVKSVGSKEETTES